MTKEQIPWYQRPVSVPMFVLLMGGLAGGGGGEMAKRMLGAGGSPVDSSARESIAVVNARLDKVERNLDSINLRSSLMWELLKEIRKEQKRDYQNAED